MSGGAEEIEIGQAALPGDPGKLGAMLVKRKLVSRKAVEAALEEQKITNEQLGVILVRNGFLPHKKLVEVILENSPGRIVTEKVNRPRIPPSVLEENAIILSAETDKLLYAATMRSEAVALAIIKQYYPDKQVEFVSFAPEHVDGFLERAYSTYQAADAPVRDEDMLNAILYRALSEQVSDVHILPRTKSYTVMFRQLGVRRHAHEGPIDEYNVMVAQIKDRARMDLAEKRIPQDGGFQIEYNNKLVDLRVATVPGVYGEIIVMRVLDSDRIQPSLDGLGITKVAEWRKGFNRQNGLCLVCGATGSGKTTTLNATVREMDRFGKAIYTVEDPVEYRMAYTGQISTNPNVGLDFARAVKAFMRSDPDVIILGEVRDPETARNAVKAADTGHLVLATLHTGSILGAVSRLRDLEVPVNELKYLLRSVLVQTLIRTICTNCGGKGCVACARTGYGSRTIVSECASFNSFTEVEETLFAGKVGWTTMVEDAILKAREGVTTMEEVRRVFGSEVDKYVPREEG